MTERTLVLIKPDGVQRLLVGRILERAAARGEIARVNARLGVEVLFGMIRGVCVYRAESDRPDDLTRLVTAVFLRGVTGDHRRTERTRPLKIVHGGTHDS